MNFSTEDRREAPMEGARVRNRDCEISAVLLVLLASLLSLACGASERDTSAPTGGPAGGNATAVAPASLTCEPSQVRRGDTITLRTRVPHGPYLAVRTPGDTLYFLVYPLLGDTTAPPPIMPADEFREASEIRLPVDEIASSPWTSEAISIRPIFTQPGAYELTVGENLETDVDLPKSSCIVQMLR